VSYTKRCPSRDRPLSCKSMATGALSASTSEFQKLDATGTIRRVFLRLAASGPLHRAAFRRVTSGIFRSVGVSGLCSGKNVLEMDAEDQPIPNERVPIAVRHPAYHVECRVTSWTPGRKMRRYDGLFKVHDRINHKRGARAGGAFGATKEGPQPCGSGRRLVLDVRFAETKEQFWASTSGLRHRRGVIEAARDLAPRQSPRSMRSAPSSLYLPESLSEDGGCELTMRPTRARRYVTHLGQPSRRQIEAPLRLASSCHARLASEAYASSPIRPANRLRIGSLWDSR